MVATPAGLEARAVPSTIAPSAVAVQAAVDALVANR